MKKIIFIFLFSISLAEPSDWNLGNVHIFGDSHSIYSFTNNAQVPATPSGDNWPLTCETSSFFYQTNGEAFSVPFQIHWISTTMHMIGELGLERLDFRKYDVQDGDFAVLHFGGIDSWHGSIIKQYVLGRELDEIIETLTASFIDTVLINQSLYNQLKVIVMAVIPPIYLDHNHAAYKQRDPNLPFIKFIVTINRMLNESLKRHSKLNNFIFLDVTDTFEDSNGMLRHDLADMHHVRPSANQVIKEKLINLIMDDLEMQTLD